MATMGVLDSISADRRNSQPPMRCIHSNKVLSKPFAEYSSNQKLQILKLRLQFLRRCIPLKRPPPSLRISGASALSNTQKLFDFSKVESVMLNIAVKNKLNEIRDLTAIVKKSNDTQKLDQHEWTKLRQHFDKKINFYISQNDTKWAEWTNKPERIFNKSNKRKNNNNKTKNYKKRQNRKQRKTIKNAKQALETGSVLILVNEDIPLGAISLLGKDLGFVPTPKSDVESERLDMRVLTNNIINQSRQAFLGRNKSTTTAATDENYKLPKKLRRQYYGTVEPTKDKFINETTQRMQSELDNALRNKKDNYVCSNLSQSELSGMKWLQKKITEERIAIVQADKGGAIIITTPELLRKKVLEKLNDENLYEKLEADPTKELHKELVDLWIYGKENNIVTSKEAKDIMGISNNMNADGTAPTNRLSTLPHYRPGKAYFYPSLKIHKCAKEDLKPGIEPPIRLITAMQDGITKRSDVYLADKLLRDLEQDFCQDLLIDTNDALLWLESTDELLDHNLKRQLRPFTFDFKSLYDSLDPDLVIEALEAALEELRPDWSDELKRWIINLVKLSLKSSVGQFGEHFYRQKNGVATGGSLCVQLANICVFYILRKSVYSNECLMEKIVSLKRYIDDGSGFFSGTQRQYSDWINRVNTLIKPDGLYIDEYTIADKHEFVSFLDIQFTFDVDGKLQTDLYVKPTDSRSYLQFGSAHANHVYSGVVYSQCLRLRRIINCNDRLKFRIEEIKQCFYNSNYPKKMVNNISDKVLKMERRLHKPHNNSNSSLIVPTTPSPQKSIRVISTYGSDTDLINITRKFESSIQSSPSLSSTTDDLSTPQHNVFNYVKRTGSSLRSKFVQVKNMALNISNSKTQPCKHKNCMCCPIISDRDSFKINGRIVKPCSGNCVTYNIIYCLHCTICDTFYVGRTVRQLNVRVGEHRRGFYKILNDLNTILANDLLRDSDDYSPAFHLIDDHGLIECSDFNKIYRVFILESCSPKLLELKEHRYIHSLKTLKPFGINSMNPFSIPLLKF